MNRTEKLEKLGNKILAKGELISCGVDGYKGDTVQGRETHVQYENWTFKLRNRKWKVCVKSISYKGLDLIEDCIVSVKRLKEKDNYSFSNH